LLHPDDVRQILAIPAGYVSDLIVDVFHDQEVNAILPDLAEAFPWPVRISTRNEVTNIYMAGWARRSGIAYLTFLPAILAIALIVVSTVRNQIGRRYELGLFKALGWTTKDLLRLQIFKSLFIGIPAITCGMAISYGLVFWPGTCWAGYIFLGWNENPPALYLNAAGAFMVLLQIALLIFLPYFTAALLPLLGGANADPQDFLEKEYI
jgi:ABC-type lipoprotein release transport system permease subunit